MANTFFISDTHFGHAKMLTFTNSDGTLVRPEFSNVEEMDEFMVERWNSVVRPQDKVYHLGDVVIRRQNLSILERLNGTKRLILGNHDIFDLKDYSKYFKKIYAMRKLDDMVLTHIPLHPESVNRFGLNVHGHIHRNTVRQYNSEFADTRYFNVSVEMINYTPISIDEVRYINQTERLLSGEDNEV